MAENVVLVLFVFCPLLCVLGLWLFFKKYKLHRTQRYRILALIAGNALVLATLLSPLLPIGEIYFRWFHDTTDSFGLSKTTARWYARHYHRNNTGFRDSIPYSTSKESDKKRLVIVGDSFTVGHGVANVEERFANQLRHLLPDWEIHVRANNGWDTDSQLDEVENLVRFQYQADAVLLVFCLNDIAPVVPEWRMILRSIRNSAESGYVVRNSYLLSMAYYRMYTISNPQVRNYYDFVLEAYSSPPWEDERQLLRGIQDVVNNELKCKLLVTTFPFLHALSSEYRFQPAHDRLNEYWKEQNIPHLDLLPVYEHSRPEDVVVNRFDAHPNERAHKMAADAIAAFLKTNL